MEKKRLIHNFIYLISLVFIAFFMPFSVFGTNFCLFLLLTNFIVELNFKQKFQRLKENWEIIVFLFLFFCPVIWLINTTDFDWAKKDIIVKLPILALPLLIGMSQPIKHKNIRYVLIAFILGVCVSSILGYLAYFQVIPEIKEIKNIRDMSPFINSIRLALMCCLSVFCIAYWLKNVWKNLKFKESKKKKFEYLKIIILIIVGLWLIFYIIKVEGLTALITGVVVAFALLIYSTVKEKRKTRKKIKLISLILFPLIICIYLSINIISYFTPTAIQNNSDTTALGNKYEDYKPSHIIRENGNLVFYDICDKELTQYWKNYSSYELQDTITESKEFIYCYLIRYMTSKGLKKDSEGLSKLTPEDIKNIENGEANYKYINNSGLNHRLYLTFQEFDNYFHTGDPNTKSIIQRFEYARIGLQLFKNNFWFGCGTGDIKSSYKQYYEDHNSKLSLSNRKRCHNQFETNFIVHGIFGGIICLVAWFFPIIRKRKTINYYFAVFFIIATMSMLSDDMLETSTAVYFCIFFYSLFLWGRKADF